MRHARRAAWCLLAGCLSAWAPEVARGGAWVQDPGTAYLRFTVGSLITDERFDSAGDRVAWDVSGGGFRDSEYQDLALTLYAEVGVAPGWNLVASIPWGRIQADQPTATFTTYGAGDIALAGKRLLWSGGGTVVSTLVGMSFPGGYNDSEYPALGSGVTEGFIVAQGGHSWGGPWANLEAEYRLRGGRYANQLRGALGGGLPAGPRLSFRGEMRGVLSTSEDPEIQSPPPWDPWSMIPFDPATAEPSFLDLAGIVSFRLGGGVALEGEVRSTVAGENTLAGTRWTLALATSPAWRFAGGE